MMKGDILVVKSPDVKCVNLCLKVIVSIPTELERSIRLTFRFSCDSSGVVYLFDCVVCGV